MKEREILSIPKRSFVLLDANVLIDSSKAPSEFAALYAEFARLEIVPILESTIRFEFLRGVPDAEAGEQLLVEFCGEDMVTLVPDKDIFRRALSIARIYMRADNKKTNVPDTLIAAQMGRYARDTKDVAEMFLATQNHKDFPPVLFQRVDDLLVTLADGSIKTIGFYRFRKDRFEEFSR